MAVETSTKKKRETEREREQQWQEMVNMHDQATSRRGSPKSPVVTSVLCMIRVMVHMIFQALDETLVQSL